MSAWRNNSCCTFTSTPHERNIVESVSEGVPPNLADFGSQRCRFQLTFQDRLLPAWPSGVVRKYPIRICLVEAPFTPGEQYFLQGRIRRSPSTVESGLRQRVHQKRFARPNTE